MCTSHATGSGCSAQTCLGRCSSKQRGEKTGASAVNGAPGGAPSHPPELSGSAKQLSGSGEKPSGVGEQPSGEPEKPPVLPRTPSDSARAYPPGTHLPAHAAQPTLDQVTTFGSDGKRVFLYPATTWGLFSRARMTVGLLLIGIYLSLPWIRIGYAPALFFDIAHRKFHFFGLTFLTQDLWLFFFVISGVGFGLYVITALWGRVWCGWACPLTVFLDVVRRIERWVQGDGPTRRRLAEEPTTFAHTLRALFKHALVLLLATTVAHSFLAYFVSLPSLLDMMRQNPREHASAFLLVAAVTGVLWFCFVWFREQFCIVLCPYGRLQSLLTDEQTLVIGYDAGRGEPRGKGVASARTSTGDCIDCRKCVQVCPTGIDIRQGLQLECIGCAACVDACNGVMRKLHRAPGLVRYDSLAGLRGNRRRFWRPRLLLYGCLMAAGLTVAGFAFSTVHSATVSLTRMPGAPYFVQQDTLRNQFLLRIFNKSSEPDTFSIQLEGNPADGCTLQGGSTDRVEGWGESKLAVVLTQPLGTWNGNTPRVLVVRDSRGNLIARKPLTLLGPAPGALQRPSLP